MSGTQLSQSQLNSWLLPYSYNEEKRRPYRFTYTQPLTPAHHHFILLLPTLFTVKTTTQRIIKGRRRIEMKTSE